MSSILGPPVPSKGVNAIPPEEAGHDYGHPPPPPAHVVALAAAARARMAAGADDHGAVRDPTTTLRLTPRVYVYHRRIEIFCEELVDK